MHYRLGLLGRHIAYSLSPQIHRWALEQCSLQGEYELHDVALDAARELIAGRQWHGLNVTVPHKTAISGICGELTRTAARIGAVNTLFQQDGIIWGDSTDAAGFAAALRFQCGERRFARPLIIGAGGAARAVLIALVEQFGCRHVTIAARNPAATTLRLNALQLCTDWRVIALADCGSDLSVYDLVVQATPVGGTRQPGTPLPGAAEFGHDAVVMDLIYASRRTEFLNQAAAAGAAVQNGLPMLIAQAATAFEKWTGHQFPLQRAMRELLPQLQADDPLSDSR